jgi:hypothetical protein
MGFDLSNYETVHERLVRWWGTYPEGQILTSIHHYDGDVVVFRAEGIDGSGKTIATGYAEEVRNSSPVNKTSFLENAETSAIGRMIQNSPIAASKERPSREEMEKVQRVAAGGGAASGPSERPQPSLTRITTIGGQSVRTEKQGYFIGSLAKRLKLDEEGLFHYVQRVLEDDSAVPETITIADAKIVIDAMKRDLGD